MFFILIFGLLWKTYPASVILSCWEICSQGALHTFLEQELYQLKIHYLAFKMHGSSACIISLTLISWLSNCTYCRTITENISISTVKTGKWGTREQNHLVTLLLLKKNILYHCKKTIKPCITVSVAIGIALWNWDSGGRVKTTQIVYSDSCRKTLLLSVFYLSPKLLISIAPPVPLHCDDVINIMIIMTSFPMRNEATIWNRHSCQYPLR